MSCLKAIQVNDAIFNQILYDFEFKVRVKPDLFQYYRGYYENKDLIYYNGKDEFICCEYIVNKYVNIIQNCTVWKQIRVQRVLNMPKQAMESTTGSKAKAYITKVLKSVYTIDEIDERLRLFEAEKDTDLIQQHYNYPAPKDTIVKLTNTFKFDINGAHTDALCEIFPKAKDKLIQMYNKRKKNPVFKQYPNLYVGMLAQKSKEMRKNGIPAKYEKTYNWIVQRTSKMLLKAMDKVGGCPIYVNTDGFIVQNPEALLMHSKTLGEFKLEFAGDTYVYTDKNYIIYQTGSEKKGSCFTAIRDDIDLSQGKVVHYDIHIVRNDKGETLYREPINIMKEIIEINEI